MLDEEDSTTMKRHRHTPEQVVRKLGEGERLLNDGKDLAEVLRHLEVSEQTWHRWRNQDGGMKADGAKRLRELGPVSEVEVSGEMLSAWDEVT
jgi:hypothetical protein